MVSTVARPTSGDSSAGTHWHRSGRGGDDLSELSIFSMEKKKEDFSEVLALVHSGVLPLGVAMSNRGGYKSAGGTRACKGW